MSAKMDAWSPYRNTGFGRPTGPRGKRPTEDTLPKHECPVITCNSLSPQGNVVHVGFVDTVDRLWFCSYGCLSRWAIVQELRQ